MLDLGSHYNHENFSRITYQTSIQFKILQRFFINFEIFNRQKSSAISGRPYLYFDTKENTMNKIGLVLSGGGARGFAHLVRKGSPGFSLVSGFITAGVCKYQFARNIALRKR